jgi:hypothetical protein
MNDGDQTTLPLQAVIATAASNLMERFLLPDQGNTNTNSRNQILYIAYLCILGCCCVTPCLYFLRIAIWQRQQVQQLREMEQAGMVAALAQSTRMQHHHNAGRESAVVRDERRARILQLMEPVRMVRTHM